MTVWNFSKLPRYANSSFVLPLISLELYIYPKMSQVKNISRECVEKQE